MDIDVLIEDDGWSELARIATRACPEALRVLGFDPAKYELSVLGCNDARIAELNGQFRAKPAPTNVLAWPSADFTPPDEPDPGELGDIAIALGTCTREAAAQGKPLDHHVTHLLIHATLHLLGYDHRNDREAAEMETIERAVLARLGIPDPY